jgi:hypothetical protein
VKEPLESDRIDLDIWFEAVRGMRPDVDNILKPILDALNGIVYADDRQVRSVRVVAVPSDDASGIAGWTTVDTIQRLGSDEQCFLINVYVGLMIGGLGP